jgi:CheY-like chemotaxis protein
VLGPKLPLIAIVQSATSAAATAAITAGASAVVEKPADEDELLDAIARSTVEGESGSDSSGEMPKILKWFFEKLAPVLAGMTPALSGSSDSEALILFYEERLTPYRDQFVDMIAALRKTAVKADLTQSIRMYGLRNTRNLVVALKVSEVMGMPLVQWNSKTGLLAGDPGHVLRFANKTAEHFGEGSRNQLEAFNSGLVLDLLSALAETTGARKSAIRNHIEERYHEVLRKADKCVAAGKGAQKLTLERHIITTLLMELAGEVSMALFSADYMEYRRKFEKKSIRPILQHIVELRQFAVSRNLMSALICQGAPGLDEASRAILFSDYPYLLPALPGSQDSLDLVNVCHVT